MREEARSLFEAVRAQAEAAAAALDKRLVVIATNAQRFLHGIDWEHYAHGAVLAGAALTVQSLLHTVYVPSPGLSPTFRPCGVHPGMDPLWSTDELEFVSDGVAVSRLDKVRELGRVPAALEFLRVCWENLDGALNCGCCEKCLRTMLELEVSGLLERTATLPRKVEPAALHRLRLPGYVLPMWLEVLRELEAHRPGAPLTLAVERLVRRAEWDRTRLGRIYSTGRTRIRRRLNREVIARADERYLGGALGALFRGTQAAARRIRSSR